MPNPFDADIVAYRRKAGLPDHPPEPADYTVTVSLEYGDWMLRVRPDYPDKDIIGLDVGSRHRAITAAEQIALGLRTAGMTVNLEVHTDES